MLIVRLIEGTIARKETMFHQTINDVIMSINAVHKKVGNTRQCISECVVGCRGRAKLNIEKLAAPGIISVIFQICFRSYRLPIQIMASLNFQSIELQMCVCACMFCIIKHFAGSALDRITVVSKVHLPIYA